MARKKPVRPYHHGDLKRALVETSIELLAAEGVEALTVAAVGRRIGVSSAAPYKHFEDRPALLRAVAAEGNRRLNEAIGVAAQGCTEAQEAFRRAGVAYVCWAAENPSLHRLTTDPSLVDYVSTTSEGSVPEALEGSIDVFWPELSALVRSGEALSATHPLVEQLRGRALAQGLATFFVSGVFPSLGITSEHAERIARAVTGEDVPAASP